MGEVYSGLLADGRVPAAGRSLLRAVGRRPSATKLPLPYLKYDSIDAMNVFTSIGFEM